MDPEFSTFPIYFYDYNEIETFCLAKREQLVEARVGMILGVLRGGGIPALMLSQMLGVPVDFIHYDRGRARADIRNPEALASIGACVKEGKKILLVEDIAGVGRTLVNCYEYVLSLVEDETRIEVLTLVHHENSRAKPHHYKDCSAVRAILPWERYVTGRSCLDDFMKTGEALLDDRRYKKTLAIDDPNAPLTLKDEWVVDRRLTFDGDCGVILDAVRAIGPEEIYCNNERLIALILGSLPFVVVYKVIDRKRYRICALD
ncbi:MAG TPA: phosphoribosyltransferase family protein [Trinickia sp.]